MPRYPGQKETPEEPSWAIRACEDSAKYVNMETRRHLGCSGYCETMGMSHAGRDELGDSHIVEFEQDNNARPSSRCPIYVKLTPD